MNLQEYYDRQQADKARDAALQHRFDREYEQGARIVFIPILIIWGLMCFLGLC